jgi:hypothetical protein
MSTMSKRVKKTKSFVGEDGTIIDWHKGCSSVMITTPWRQAESKGLKPVQVLAEVPLSDLIAFMVQGPLRHLSRPCSKCGKPIPCPPFQLCPGVSCDQTAGCNGLPTSGIAEEIGEENPQALSADGLDEAIIGVARRCGQPSLLAYSVKGIIEILMKRDGMTYPEAAEFFDYNIVGSWVGEGTPLYVYDEEE